MKSININTIGCNALTRVDKNTNATLDGNVATDILAVKAFFLTTQRNAWHSTTSNRYNSTTSTFLSKEEAEAAAENLRKMGSKFTIDEVPAIVITFLNGYILLAHINTNTPFEKYSLTSLPCNSRIVKRKQYGCLRSYLHTGINVIEILQSFCWNSNFWIKNQDNKNSILSFLSLESSKKFCLLEKKESLKKYKSYSNGAKYYLGWTEEKDVIEDVKSNFVYKLIEQSKKSNATHTNSEVKITKISNAKQTKQKVKITKKSNLLKLDIKRADKYGRKNKLVTLAALALATEYYTKVESRPEIVEECLYCLRVIGENNAVYVTENVYHAVHKGMDGRKAVKALLLPSI